MPESEPMAFVQGMILQIRKHIPESGYLPTCSDRKPLKKYLGKSTDSKSESEPPNDSKCSSPVNVES